MGWQIELNLGFSFGTKNVQIALHMALVLTLHLPSQAAPSNISNTRRMLKESAGDHLRDPRFSKPVWAFKSLLTEQWLGRKPQAWDSQSTLEWLTCNNVFKPGTRQTHASMLYLFPLPEIWPQAFAPVFFPGELPSNVKLKTALCKKPLSISPNAVTLFSSWLSISVCPSLYSPSTVNERKHWLLK